MPRFLAYRLMATAALIWLLALAGCDTGANPVILPGLAGQIGAGVANALSNLIEAGILTAVL
jgi:hypothetical protein